MIIICNDWKEYETCKETIYNLSEEIEVLAVRNEDAFMYYSPGDNEAKKTCTFDLIKSKIGTANWFCTLQTLLDTVKNHFKDEEPMVEISLEDIAKAFDIPSKCIKIID
jgi:hypothetical protein